MATIDDVDQKMNEVSSVLTRSFGASGSNLTEKVTSAQRKLGALAAQLINHLDNERKTFRAATPQAPADSLYAEADSVLRAIKTLEKVHAAYNLPHLPPPPPPPKNGAIWALAVAVIIAIALSWQR